MYVHMWYRSDHFYFPNFLDLLFLFFQLKAALKEQARLTPETDSFFDHWPLEAVPWVSSAVTTIPCSSTVTTSATCLSTVTTTTSSTVMSTQCPLTWFATVTEKQPRLDSSWTRSEHDTKNGELSIEMEDVESACPATCMEIQSSCSSATKKRSPFSIKGATQTETFSLQTQTPQNLVVSIFVRPALKICLFVVNRPAIFILVKRIIVQHHKAFREMPKLSRVTEFSIDTEQSLYGCILFLRQFHLKLYVRYCIKITLRCIHFVQEVFGLFPTYNGDFEMVGGKRRQKLTP